MHVFMCVFGLPQERVQQLAVEAGVSAGQGYKTNKTAEELLALALAHVQGNAT